MNKKVYRIIFNDENMKAIFVSSDYPLNEDDVVSKAMKSCQFKDINDIDKIKAVVELKV